MIAAGGSGTKDLKLLYRHTYEVTCVSRFKFSGFAVGQYRFLSQVAGCLDNDGRTIQALDTGDNGHLLAMGSTGNHIRLASIL